MDVRIVKWSLHIDAPEREFRAHRAIQQKERPSSQHAGRLGAGKLARGIHS